MPHFLSFGHKLAPFHCAWDEDGWAEDLPYLQTDKDWRPPMSVTFPFPVSECLDPGRTNNGRLA